MTALIIIAGIVLFIFLLTIIPIRLNITYNDEFVVKAKYLFFSFDLIEPEEENLEDVDVEDEEDKTEEKRKDGIGTKFKEFFKREGFFGFLDFLRDLLKLLSEKVVYLVKHLRISKFDLYLRVGGEDAAEMAIQYGQVSAVAYAVFNILFKLTPCKNKRISVDLDYNNPEYVVDFNATLRVKPLTLLITGISTLIKGLPFVKRFNGIQNKKVKNS